MKASNSILLLTPFVVQSVTGANVPSSSVALANNTAAPTTINIISTVIANPTFGGGTTTISSFGGAYPTAYPACISFVNGSAVAVPINGSAVYPSGHYPTVYINSTAASPAPTGANDFNGTIYASGPAGSPTATSFVVLTTATPAFPSSQPLAPRQVISSTASPSFGNATQTVTIVYPSSFGGSNSATFSTAVTVVAYPTTYPSPYPSSLPLCADLAGNASSTLASNNTFPSPTTNASTLNQQADNHSAAPRLGMSLSVALLGVGTAVAALVM
ncbi:hypothetical protein D9619_007981 [Psilocybe cf. subviscida]|uniref:Uncharacterized protein n=1 Tax=Psilocybe cf. subviscida TaxID=2480587 RepID=A0A8H5AUD2_9AGAR|nr:hypothetical protein D9619_007981 [Psilocybe cf. subviscida]